MHHVGPDSLLIPHSTLILIFQFLLLIHILLFMPVTLRVALIHTKDEHYPDKSTIRCVSSTPLHTTAVSN